MIYSMNLEIFEQSQHLCEKGAAADKLYIIESGVVKVVSMFDKRQEEEFIIERLTRGAIINAKSFLVNDDVDTDFICETTVKCYILSSEVVKNMENRMKQLNIMDLANVRKKVYTELSIPKCDIALDYILHNTETESIENFTKKTQHNNLKVKLKNAVMQQWTLVKNKRKTKTLAELMDQMMADKDKNKKQKKE